MTPPGTRLHLGPLRAVTALRALILVVLAGLILWTALSWGRRGAPQADITMSPAQPPPTEGPVLDQSDKFSASGTREGRPAFDLAAQTVTGFEGEKKRLESVNLTVHEVEGGSVQVTSHEGQFDPGARRAQLSGDVAIRTPDGLSLTTGNLFYDSDRDMIYTGDPLRFELGQVTGTGQGMNYLVDERRIKIASRVDLTIQVNDGGPPARIRAGSLVASLAENSAVFTENAVLERGADRLTGNYLRLVLDEKREQVREIRSFGDVVVSMGPDAEGKSSEMRADSLVIAMGPDNLLKTAEASGGCRVVSGPYTSNSRTAFFDRGADRLQLRGDPVVLTENERVTAQEIDLRPEKQALEARGDVRTVSLRQSGNVPGFGTAGAVSFQAARMLAEQSEHRATYEGGARAWQEGTSLQADQIVVDEGARQIRAAGSVMSRFTERPSPRDPSGRPVATSVTSRRLTVDDAKGTALYEEDARLVRPDATLTADRITLETRAAGKRRELARVLGNGSVSARHAGAFATATAAEYLPDRQTLELTDENGLAEVVDSATGRSMKGRSLTYDLAGDRVLTEAAAGARTWITLTPGGPRGVEPPPSRH
jgi:LPS export ABC transporter protein LptC